MLDTKNVFQCPDIDFTMELGDSFGIWYMTKIQLSYHPLIERVLIYRRQLDVVGHFKVLFFTEIR